MSTLLITGLVLMGAAFVLSIFVFLGAAKNMQEGVTGNKGFDQTFNNHVGAMKRMALLALPLGTGIVVTIIAVLRDYVLN